MEVIKPSGARERGWTRAPRLLGAGCRQQSGRIARHDPASRGSEQQARHGWAFVHKHADVAFWPWLLSAIPL